MKNFSVFLISILLMNPIHAQPLPSWSQNEANNSPYLFDFFHEPKIQLDHHGNCIVGGNFFDMNLGYKFFIIKYDSTGNLLWKRLFNDSINIHDQLNDFTIDQYDNIYATGFEMLDSISSAVKTIKYDSTGNLSWENTFIGSGDSLDYGNSVIVDQSGNCFVTGGTFVDSSKASRILILKINADGTTGWSEHYGTSLTDGYEGMLIKKTGQHLSVAGQQMLVILQHNFIALTIDTLGNFISAQETLADKDFSRFAIDDHGNFYVGTLLIAKYRVYKFNPAGIFLWQYQYPSSQPFGQFGDDVFGLTTNASGNVFATGMVSTDTSSADMLTVKLDSAGNLIWASRYNYLGKKTAEIGWAIATDNFQNVFVAGSGQRDSLSNYDYIVERYDPDGSLYGEIRYDDPYSSENAIFSLALTKSCVFVTGLTFENQSTSITTQKYCSFKVGINSPENFTPSVSISPNPATSEIIVTGLSSYLNSVFIYDSNKKRVFESANKQQYAISLKNFSPGIYILEAISGAGVVMKKFIIQK